MIASKLCSSSNEMTSYIVTKLSTDIKSGLLPQPYNVVFDEAYPCLAQEMSPWMGIPVDKDAFNYHLSVCCQVIIIDLNFQLWKQYKDVPKLVFQGQAGEYCSEASHEKEK
jgi:hypothetical protein